MAGRPVRAALCGFGLVAAAAQSARLLARLEPRKCILVGIAGTLDSARLPLGSVLLASEIFCHGIGAGEGAGWLSPREMDLAQIPAEGGSEAIFDRLCLPLPAQLDHFLCAPLLSVTSCSGDARQASAHRRRYPGALAEDMESFAVALACRQAGVPLVVLRAISNLAGDRDLSRWQISAALRALRAALATLVEAW